MSTDLLSSTMKATAEAFVNVWSGDWTAETNRASISFRAPECQHYMAPETLNIPGRSNSEWSTYFERLHGAVTGATTVIHETVVAPKERRAVVHSSLEASTTVGPFKNEYVWFLSFDDSGKIITDIKEFLDSLVTKDIQARLAAART